MGAADAQVLRQILDAMAEGEPRLAQLLAEPGGLGGGGLDRAGEAFQIIGHGSDT
jgi:hypothetical protein